MQDLRKGVFDVLVGVNLLREGLDLPEVSLVTILDADKEGFLRSARSLTQTVGRAARHLNGKAIMYADKITGSMKATIQVTEYRRNKQIAHNHHHHIVPKTIYKRLQDSLVSAKEAAIISETEAKYQSTSQIENDITKLEPKKRNEQI